MPLSFDTRFPAPFRIAVLPMSVYVACASWGYA